MKKELTFRTQLTKAFSVFALIRSSITLVIINPSIKRISMYKSLRMNLIISKIIKIIYIIV